MSIDCSTAVHVKSDGQSKVRQSSLTDVTVRLSLSLSLSLSLIVVVPPIRFLPMKH